MEPADEAPRAYIPFLPAVKSGQPRHMGHGLGDRAQSRQWLEANIPCVQR